MAAALASPPRGSEMLIAWKFFLDLTGIELEGELTYFGWLPNPKTRDDLKRVRDWYSLHRTNLRWDSTTRRVVLDEPKGAREPTLVDPKVLDVWKQHLAVLERATTPLAADIRGLDAFFQPLTGLSLRFDHATGHPTTETREDFGRLQAWFASHKERLYWDDQSQTVKEQPTTATFSAP